MKKQLETLTIENIKPYAMTVRQKDYPEYGNWGITKDGEFYSLMYQTHLNQQLIPLIPKNEDYLLEGIQFHL